MISEKHFMCITQTYIICRFSSKKESFIQARTYLRAILVGAILFLLILGSLFILAFQAALSCK